MCVVKSKTKQLPLSLLTAIHSDATVQKTIPITCTKPEAIPTWISILIPVQRGYTYPIPFYVPYYDVYNLPSSLASSTEQAEVPLFTDASFLSVCITMSVR